MEGVPEYALLYGFTQPSSPGPRGRCSTVRRQVLVSVSVWEKMGILHGFCEKLMEKEEKCWEAREGN